MYATDLMVGFLSDMSGVLTADALHAPAARQLVEQQVHAGGFRTTMAGGKERSWQTWHIR